MDAAVEGGPVAEAKLRKSSEAIAARTVFLEIPNVLAINLIGNPSARYNLRISAQSSTDNNSFAPIGSIEPTVSRRGSIFGRRHGVSFQASPTRSVHARIHRSVRAGVP